MTIFKDIITVFNVIPQHGREPPRLQSRAESYVFWDGASGASFSKTGAAQQDSATIIIPFRDSYMSPARWFDSGCPADSFTLRPGDVIVRGLASEDDSITAAELQKKYGSDCITISEVRNRCYGSKSMWHWEVTGK